MLFSRKALSVTPAVFGMCTKYRRDGVGALQFDDDTSFTRRPPQYGV
jgi:hypothetical protein